MFRNRIFNALAIIRAVIVITIGYLARTNRSWIYDRFYFIKLDFIEEWKEWASIAGSILVVLGVLLLFYRLYSALRESILNGIQEGQRLIDSPQHATLTLRMQQVVIYLLLMIAGFAFYMSHYYWISTRYIFGVVRYITMESVRRQDQMDTISFVFFSAGVILLIAIFFYTIQKMVTKQVLKADYQKRMSSKSVF